MSYRSYWTREILEVLREHKASLSIKDISEKTAIRTGEQRLAALHSTTHQQQSQGMEGLASHATLACCAEGRWLKPACQAQCGEKGCSNMGGWLTSPQCSLA